MFTRSIRWRLQVWQAFLLVCVLTGFGVTAYQLHRLNVLGRIDTELDRRVAAIVSDLRGRGPFGGPPGRPPFDEGHEPPPPHRGGEGAELGPPFALGPGPDRFFRGHGGGFMEGPGDSRTLRLSPKALALFGSEETSEFYYAVWSPTGNLLARASNAPPALERPSPSGLLTGIHSQMVGNRREAFQYTGLGLCVIAGRPVGVDIAGIHRFAGWLVAAGVTVLAVGLGGGWILAGRALRPVEDISMAATRISAGRLSERIDVTETESELGRLAGILNSTFARLESAFAQQQQFTADASHELRTPIAVIIAESQTALSRDRTAAEYKETLNVCLDAAQQMRRLARALLELARYDAGEEALDRRPLDLAEPVRECLELIAPLARERSLTLHSDLSPTPVNGDADRLMQLITNLLTNAITYNREQGEIRVRTRLSGSLALLEVSDTGQGISAAELPNIFKRFHRADRSRSRTEGHQGLGLAICRAVVEAHGGTLEATSTPGAGSTFTVCLPAGSVLA